MNNDKIKVIEIKSNITNQATCLSNFPKLIFYRCSTVSLENHFDLILIEFLPNYFAYFECHLQRPSYPVSFEGFCLSQAKCKFGSWCYCEPTII